MDLLCDDILLEIFVRLDARSLLCCSHVSRRWLAASRAKSLWQSLVLKRWPSQRWLYADAGTCQLNWRQVYRELYQRRLYCADQMKYLVTCNTIEDELVSPPLRQSMFAQIEHVAAKWLQVSARDHDDISQRVDKNMELYFNVDALSWEFFDKRRDYLSDLFAHKRARPRYQERNLHIIRPYQVIPSCLMMYRWMCVFRGYLTEEAGLTFYRVWRFRLKHMESGLIFELCDWKAAMSSTFAGGCPSVVSFRNDCLQLLQLLSHPHFIMHPGGLHPRIERLYNSMINASAGGCLNQVVRKQKKNRRRQQASKFPARKSPLLSPTVPKFTTKDPFATVAAATTSLELPCSSTTSLLQQEDATLSRASSCNSLFSCGGWNTETEESQREMTSDSCESELDFYDSGYVCNCEYFISSAHTFDSIEEQHNYQAAVADQWLLTRDQLTNRSTAVYDIFDNYWYFTEQKNQGTTDGEDRFAPVYDEGSVVEAIPSSLMLYRLVCLFELNCTMYNCMEDSTVWKVAILHKKTAGILQFHDQNGSLKVNVSLQRSQRTENSSEFDFNEFRSAVTQILALLMDENFCHPYGTVAGAVA